MTVPYRDAISLRTWEESMDVSETGCIKNSGHYLSLVTKSLVLGLCVFSKLGFGRKSPVSETSNSPVNGDINGCS